MINPISLGQFTLNTKVTLMLNLASQHHLMATSNQIKCNVSVCKKKWPRALGVTHHSVWSFGQVINLC